MVVTKSKKSAKLVRLGGSRLKAKPRTVYKFNNSGDVSPRKIGVKHLGSIWGNYLLAWAKLWGWRSKKQSLLPTKSRS
ncbi:MAG TPA: hypothetical protein VFH31_15450 [Pyrinomonadaceae bacterium]|nr:hypothetical protein [Pyrinomonadaceae bacterium]